MVDFTYLEKFTLGSPESDESHLAGVSVDLLHQESQAGRPGLPVLQLVLGVRVKTSHCIGTDTGLSLVDKVSFITTHFKASKMHFVVLLWHDKSSSSTERIYYR